MCKKCNEFWKLRNTNGYKVSQLGDQPEDVTHVLKVIIEGEDKTKGHGEDNVKQSDH